MNNEVTKGLFTQEQQDYVNSIEDKDLRAHLLHQVRLRDILSADRDAFEKQAGAWPTIAKAVERITSAMLEDKSEGSFYYSWQSNIAMAFRDEWERHDTQGYCKSEHLHMVANNAAKNFLDLLCKKLASKSPYPDNKDIVKVPLASYNHDTEVFKKQEARIKELEEALSLKEEIINNLSKEIDLAQQHLDLIGAPKYSVRDNELTLWARIEGCTYVEPKDVYVTAPETKGGEG